MEGITTIIKTRRNIIKSRVKRGVYYIFQTKFSIFARMRIKSHILIALFFILCTASPISAADEKCDSLIHLAINAALEKDYKSSQELLSQAKQEAIEKDSPEQLFWVLTNTGINYAELLNYSDALDNFFEAYKIAVNKLNKRHEMSILNNIAGLYLTDNKFDKAIEYYTTVYETVKDSPDSLFIGGCAMNIASASINIDNLKQAEYYLQTAEKMLENYPADLLRLQTLKTNLLLKKGLYKQAYTAALKNKETIEQADNKALKIGALIDLIHSCIALDNYPATIQYSLEALKENVNLEERKTLYKCLSDAYFETAMYKDALGYKDSIIQTIDSIWKIQGKKQFENSHIQFELYKQEKELEEYKTRARNRNYLLGLSILLVIILIWALINQIIKHRQQKKIVELELEQEKKNQQLLQNELLEQQTKSLLEEERFRHEIEIKDKELMSKAMVMANRNDLIYKIINTLSNSKAIKESNDSTLKESIRQLRRTLDENEEWKNFTTYFEQRNETFITALKGKYPELNANEIRFLSLIYINLNTKEIALLLNITPEYCKKKKQQLARKLGLDNTKTIYSFLNSL